MGWYNGIGAFRFLIKFCDSYQTHLYHKATMCVGMLEILIYVEGFYEE